MQKKRPHRKYPKRFVIPMETAQFERLKRAAAYKDFPTATYARSVLMEHLRREKVLA